MLNIFEVNETNHMIEQEKLDVQNYYNGELVCWIAVIVIYKK